MQQKYASMHRNFGCSQIFTVPKHYWLSLAIVNKNASIMEPCGTDVTKARNLFKRYINKREIAFWARISTVATFFLDKAA